MRLQSFLDAAAPGFTIDMDPSLNTLWRTVNQTEKGMVFQDGGDSSLTLQFLLFCNGSVPSIVDNDYSATRPSDTNGEEVTSATFAESATLESNTTVIGNIGI